MLKGDSVSKYKLNDIIFVIDNRRIIKAKVIRITSLVNVEGKEEIQYTTPGFQESTWSSRTTEVMTWSSDEIYGTEDEARKAIEEEILKEINEENARITLIDLTLERWSR